METSTIYDGELSFMSGSLWERFDNLDKVENMDKEDELSIILQNFSWSKKGKNKKWRDNKNKLNQIYKKSITKNRWNMN